MGLRFVLISVLACAAFSATLAYADGMPQAEDDDDNQPSVNPAPYVPPPYVPPPSPPPRPQAKAPTTTPVAPPPPPAPAPAAVDKEPAPAVPPPSTTAQVTPPPAPTPTPAPATTPASPSPQFSSSPQPTPAPAAPPASTTTPPPTAVTVSPAPAATPAAPGIASAAAKAIASITYADARRVKNEPGYITITIQGVTKGEGWTNITLKPQDVTPNGPTRTFGVVATPPTKSQSQAEQPVKISVKMAMPADVKMIVLQSETNHQDANILP